ncbi:MAG TPA: SUMF1/EgtB/PvdO family nonheme iron enzyme [Pirellulales bacterium]|nr:SUMF1/EgtB/PvdO family nonheme iron enzyme [Pirellulales bacterium]
MSIKPSRESLAKRRARRAPGDDAGMPLLLLVLLAVVALSAGGWIWFRTRSAHQIEASKPRTSVQSRAQGVELPPVAAGSAIPPELTPSDDGPPPTPPADPTANMVLIPAGRFLFGDEKEEIDLPAYYIDRYEVSQAEYFQFMEYVRRGGGHKHCHPDEPPDKDHTPLDWGRPDLTDPRFPVVGLDYWDVWAYAGWVGKRLPTEQEWEKAARGTDDRLYPWGDHWDPDRCNWGPSPGNPRTLLAVDSMPEGVSPFGCFHMLGNAAEWTASFIDEERRVHSGRGYCWRIGHMVPYVLTYRMAGTTDLRDEGSGLRCALDAPADGADPAASEP